MSQATSEILDERAPYAEEIVAGWPYYLSKIYQEQLAFEHGARLGIEVVAVNPSLLLGPGDRAALVDRRRAQVPASAQIPACPTGGINFVDARDAAAATAAALERGRAGERYLLGGANWTFEEFFGGSARARQRRRRRGSSCPRRGTRCGATLVEELYRWRGKEPPVDRISVEMGEHYWWIDSSQGASSELGFAAARSAGDARRHGPLARAERGAGAAEDGGGAGVTRSARRADRSVGARSTPETGGEQRGRPPSRIDPPRERNLHDCGEQDARNAGEHVREEQQAAPSSPHEGGHRARGSSTTMAGTPACTVAL